MNYAVEPSEAAGMSARRLERIGPAMQAYVDRGVYAGINTPHRAPRAAQDRACEAVLWWGAHGCGAIRSAGSGEFGWSGAAKTHY